MKVAGWTLRRGLALAVLVLAGCGTGGPSYPPADASFVTSIFVVRQGWHTDIAIRRSDIPVERWPEAADFPQATYLLVGWGDRDFYPSTEFSLWYAFKAIFWPTASVLHVTGFDVSPARRFTGTEVIEIPLTRQGVERLAGYIGSSFERDGAARAQPLSPSPYGPGWFYPSRETFHLFHTCNVWTAQALRAAGLPVSDFLALTTESVMAQLRRLDRTAANSSAAARCASAHR